MATYMSWLTHRVRNAQWRIRQKYVHNFAFIHIPKTGGTSINRALGLADEHKTALQLRGRLGAERWERKFRFAFVRNPWDRAVSAFKFARDRNKDSRFVALSFRDWLRLAYVERHPLYFDTPVSFLPQFDWISDDSDCVLVDFVGRFENLAVDFTNVCERIGRKVPTLPHHNSTKRDDYRSYYDDESIEIIAHWYRKDIEYFCYEFSPSTEVALRQMRKVEHRQPAGRLTHAT
jgi:chondroitin 4-sulfotransferase 11